MQREGHFDKYSTPSSWIKSKGKMINIYSNKSQSGAIDPKPKWLHTEKGTRVTTSWSDHCRRGQVITRVVDNELE